MGTKDNATVPPKATPTPVKAAPVANVKPAEETPADAGTTTITTDVSADQSNSGQTGDTGGSTDTSTSGAGTDMTHNNEGDEIGTNGGTPPPSTSPEGADETPPEPATVPPAVPPVPTAAPVVTPAPTEAPVVMPEPTVSPVIPEVTQPPVEPAVGASVASITAAQAATATIVSSTGEILEGYAAAMSRHIQTPQSLERGIKTLANVMNRILNTPTEEHMDAFLAFNVAQKDGVMNEGNSLRGAQYLDLVTRGKLEIFLKLFRRVAINAQVPFSTDNAMKILKSAQVIQYIQRKGS
jgi:hypothetical protein